MKKIIFSTFLIAVLLFGILGSNVLADDGKSKSPYSSSWWSNASSWWSNLWHRGGDDSGYHRSSGEGDNNGDDSGYHSSRGGDDSDGEDRSPVASPAPTKPEDPPSASDTPPTSTQPPVEAPIPTPSPTPTQTPPAVSTGGSSGITTTSAKIAGNLTNLGTSTTVSVSFQYGSGTGPGYTGSTTAQSMNATGTFSANMSGLSPNTTYRYCAVAGTSVGSVLTFTTSAVTVAPSVTTNTATSATASAATLNGNLDALGSSTSVAVSFQYGADTGYGSTATASSMNAIGAFSANISGLSASTTYHYRAVAGGVNGNDITFTTSAPSTVAPSVRTDAANSITTSAATLNGNLTVVGTTTPVAVSFQYGSGAGPGYTGSTTAQSVSVTGSFSANISGLSPSTTYRFRAVVGSVVGSELTFTTSAVTVAPSVRTDAANSITTTTATLNGTLTVVGSVTPVAVSFQYGLTNSYGSTTSAQSRNATGAFSANISGLVANSTYHYRAVAGSAVGGDATFQTAAIPPAVRTDAASALAATTATLNGTLTVVGSVTPVAVSFQYGLTNSYGSTTSAQSRNATGAFSANISGLVANSTYHYRAVAGSAVGSDATFQTAAPAVSFSGVIEPLLISKNCTGCHSGSSPSSGIDLTTHSGVSSAGMRLYNSIASSSGKMWNYGGSTFTAAQRQSILDWINAGAPNN